MNNYFYSKIIKPEIYEHIANDDLYTNSSNESRKDLIKNMKKKDEPNLPHKISLDLPHIQKIYDKDNEEYLQYYYSKIINKDKKIEEKIDPKIFHIDCLNDRGDFPHLENKNKSEIIYINPNINNKENGDK
jgi:hypothetical protein